MQKDDLIYIAEMRDLARSVVTKVAGVDWPGFDADENLRLAVTHLIQTIGEAARHVSAGFRRLWATSMHSKMPALCRISRTSPSSTIWPRTATIPAPPSMETRCAAFC
jgi:hypothetical protein